MIAKARRLRIIPKKAPGVQAGLNILTKTNEFKVALEAKIRACGLMPQDHRLHPDDLPRSISVGTLQYWFHCRLW